MCSIMSSSVLRQQLHGQGKRCMGGGVQNPLQLLKEWDSFGVHLLIVSVLLMMLLLRVHAKGNRWAVVVCQWWCAQ
jgi:hypothetical protein